MTSAFFSLPRCSFAVLTLALCATLAGCDKQPGAPAAAANAPAPALNQAEMLDKARARAEVADLAQADPATPASQYLNIDSGNQLMYSYLALSGVPPDYEAVAQRISKDYSGTNDAFRKQAVLDALKPQIDAAVLAAKSRRYLRYQVNGQGALQPYAMDKGAFPSKVTEPGTYYYMFDNGEYKLAFTNGEQFSMLKVAPEAARAIEAARSSYKNFSIVLYVFAQQADTAQHLVKAQIVRIAILLNGVETPVQAAH